MRTTTRVDVNQYGYASGRIRALEARLLDTAQLNRLFEARTAEEINRIMQESGYPAEEPETSLKLETSAVYQLIVSLMPDRGFVEALLVFNDCHNLKVIEKYLATWWPRQHEHTLTYYETDPLDRPDDLSDLSAQELPTVTAQTNYQAIENQMHQPSLVDPERLFRAIRDRQPDLIPAWLYQAALDAAAAMQARYDVAEIDQILDRVAYREAIQRAEALENRFFLGYLHLKADLTNLDSLLRCKALKADERLLKQTLLPAGTLKAKFFSDVYDLEPEALHDRLAETRFAVLAPFALPGEQRNRATQFGKVADNLLLEYLQKARTILRGPEIPLAYLIARLLEIKNIRIAQTLQRNRIPASQGRELMRNSYFGRR